MGGNRGCRNSKLDWSLFCFPPSTVKASDLHSCRLQTWQKPWGSRTPTTSCPEMRVHIHIGSMGWVSDLFSAFILQKIRLYTSFVFSRCNNSSRITVLVVRQAPLSWGFSRQEYWSGLPCPPPGNLPNPGIKSRSPTLQADSLPAEPSGKLSRL